jgi:large-conductance mechanosensitive channel
MNKLKAIIKRICSALLEFCSTDLERHALITGLMMPFSNLYHPREKLSENFYSKEKEAHYVQFGEVISTLIILGIIALILWRVIK